MPMRLYGRQHHLPPAGTSSAPYLPAVECIIALPIFGPKAPLKVLSVVCCEQISGDGLPAVLVYPLQDLVPQNVSAAPFRPSRAVAWGSNLVARGITKTWEERDKFPSQGAAALSLKITAFNLGSIGDLGSAIGQLTQPAGVSERVGAAPVFRCSSGASRWCRPCLQVSYGVAPVAPRAGADKPGGIWPAQQCRQSLRWSERGKPKATGACFLPEPRRRARLDSRSLVATIGGDIVGRQAPGTYDSRVQAQRCVLRRGSSAEANMRSRLSTYTPCDRR